MKNTLEIMYSPEIEACARTVSKDVAASLGYPDSRPSFEAYLSTGKQVKQLRNVAKKTGLDLRSARMLEIGSGFGMFLCVANKLGLDCYGVSPALGAYRRQFEGAQTLLARNDIASDRLVNATGERLPFDTGSMDLVVSFDVLEHVQSPLAVLKESLRVLKPGGLLYGFAGTSGYWWEWHYAIPWIPGLPRWLARHWVRSFGRNPAFLDELNLLSTPRFKRQLRSLEGCMLERFCSETRLPPAATECLTWLNSVQQTELVAQTGAARGSPLGLRWCRLVMHPAIRLACGAFSIHPVLEFVIRKTAH